MIDYLEQRSYNTLQLDGSEIAYREAGETGRPVVLALHGYPSSSAVWLPLLNNAESLGVRVIAPDLPGYGHSQLWKRTATWACHTDFVEAFYSALGLENIHLAVHDWGGLIGLRWAIEHRDRILSLFITNTTLFADYPWHEFSRELRTPGAGEAALERRALPVVFNKGMQRSFPWLSEQTLSEWHLAYSSPEKRQAQLELYRSGNEAEITKYEERLGDFNVPVTIAWGQADPFITEVYAHRFKNALRNSELHLLEGGGHFWHHQMPEKLVALFERHLARSA